MKLSPGYADGRPKEGTLVIHTVWPYLAVMLLAAGLFPAVERGFNWRIFNVLSPIVLTYLFVTWASPSCSASTSIFAASGRWRRSASSPPRRCWPRAIRAPVPVRVLLALLGYILGTGFGLLVAAVMSALAGPVRRLF
jgi:hypothetical protein